MMDFYSYKNGKIALQGIEVEENAGDLEEYRGVV